MKSQEDQIESLKHRHDALIAAVRDVLSSAVGANSIHALRDSCLFGANNPLGGTRVDVESLRIEWTDSTGDNSKIEFNLRLHNAVTGHVFAEVRPICSIGRQRADDPGVFWTDLTTANDPWHFETATESKDSKPADREVIATLATVRKPLPSPWAR